MMSMLLLLGFYALCFICYSPPVSCQNYWPYVGGTPHRNHISFQSSGFPVVDVSDDLEMFGKNVHLLNGKFTQPPTVGANITFAVTGNDSSPNLTAFDMNTTQILWKEEVYSYLEETAVHPTQPVVCFCEKDQKVLKIKCRKERGELLWERELVSFINRKPPQYVVLEFLNENLLVVELSNDGPLQRVLLQHYGLSFDNGTTLWTTLLPNLYIHNSDPTKEEECRVVFDYVSDPANMTLDQIDIYTCSFSPLTITHYHLSQVYTLPKVDTIWSWSPKEVPQRLRDLVLYNEARTLLVGSGPRLYGLNTDTGAQRWSYTFSLENDVDLFVTGSTLTTLDAPTGQTRYHVYLSNEKLTQRLSFAQNSIQLVNTIQSGSDGHGAVGLVPAALNKGVATEYLYLCNELGFQVLNPNGQSVYATHSDVHCHDVIIASPNRIIAFSQDDQTIYFFYTGPPPPTSPPPEGWAHADDSTRANLPSWALVLIGVLTIVAIVLVIGFFLYYSYYRYRVYKGEFYQSF